MIVLDAKWEGTKPVVLYCNSLDWLIRCYPSDTVEVFVDGKRMIVPKGHLSSFKIREVRP